MPQRDLYHYIVRSALEKAGWIILNDPLRLKLDQTQVFIDLEAEKNAPSFGNGNSVATIAIEIKVLGIIGIVDQIEKALGQYILYRGLLELQRPSHQCYLAVPEDAYQSHMAGPDLQYVLQSNRIHILTFNPQQEEVVRWIQQSIINS